jgi:hypothetical protein
MGRIYFCFLTALLNSAPVAAQPASPDSQTTQLMLAEIRQLRQDLQSAAATIQRVQIVMYRLQSQAALLDRATQRLDQARAVCDQVQDQRRRTAAQIEQAEARRRDSRSQSDQAAAEELLVQLKSSAEMWAGDEQRRQVEQADAENQVRAEQAKTNTLQDQLDQLDRVLSAYGRK